MRLATLIAIVLLAAAALVGCGSDEEPAAGGGGAETAGEATAPPGAEALACPPHAADAEQLRATGVSCPRARELMFRWQGLERCAPPAGASRVGCTIDDYRCQATVADRGVSVSCAKPGRSVAFLSLRQPAT